MMSVAADPVRVLVVDDSAVIRTFVTASLEEEPDIVIAATAPNGAVALERLERTPIDVVVLDVEMPVLDGIATLAKLRPRWPDLPVIMYSTLTQRGATATLDALALGATDYVLKPSHLGDAHAASQSIKRELAPLLRTWGTLHRLRLARRHLSLSTGRTDVASVASPTEIESETRVATATPFAGRSRPDAVIIGASTGGPEALTEVIPNLSLSLGVPVLVVQHMPPLFTKLLADRLNVASALKVIEASDGLPITGGTVYIAPGGMHMVVRAGRSGFEIALDDGPPENSCKPAVDVLFRSAVNAWGANLLAVMLTGMGQDGCQGCKAVAQAGGPIIIQDEPSSVIWGMPGAVQRAGLANEVLSIKEIAPAIGRIASTQRARVPA